MILILAEPTAAEVAAQLSASFRGLCKTLAQLQPEEIDSGRMSNGWCPKALLAHIAFLDAMSGFIYSMSMHELEHAEDIWK